MQKTIAVNELAELVNGLLLKPELVGELDLDETYSGFVEAIATVVADYCGGTIDGVVRDNDDRVSGVQVSPNDSLPSLEENIWSLHDRDAWVQPPEVKTDALTLKNRIAKTRSALINLLPTISQKKGIPAAYPIEASIIDWFDAENAHQKKSAPPSREFDLRVAVGNQTYIEIDDDQGRNALYTVIEINKGVPAIHVGIQGETQLSIHAAHGGLVLTPDIRQRQLKPAPIDDYSYYGDNSLFIPAE